MSAPLHCYPTAGKPKAVEICQAFADGCGGHVVLDGELRDGPAVFFGVNESNAHIWRQVRAETRPFYFIDNSYFDTARHAYFRVTKDRLQHSGEGVSTGERFRALKIKVERWREPGEWVVVCPQSDDFMKMVVRHGRDWFADALADLAPYKKRIRVRAWNRDKKAAAATLGDDLNGALCLVTWSSAAAVTALLAGVPVVAQSADCAARRMGGNIFRLDDLPRPTDREKWAGVLADNQWTVDEMRRGVAWAALCA
jgi:hypothetical protein